MKLTENLGHNLIQGLSQLLCSISYYPYKFVYIFLWTFDQLAMISNLWIVDILQKWSRCEIVYSDSTRRVAHANKGETSHQVKIGGLGVFELGNLGQKMSFLRLKCPLYGNWNGR